MHSNISASPIFGETSIYKCCAYGHENTVYVHEKSKDVLGRGHPDTGNWDQTIISEVFCYITACGTHDKINTLTFIVEFLYYDDSSLTYGGSEKSRWRVRKESKHC